MPRDIEEFLKMAAKRRQQQKQQSGNTGQRPAQPTPARRRLAQQSRPPVQPAADDIVIIGSSDGTMQPVSVSNHVRQHLDTSDISDHATQLGEEVALADEKLDARLHQTFDHQLGRLKKRQDVETLTTTTSKDVSPIAADLLDMLSNPKSIRQAILLNEILKRPEFD